MLFFSSWFRSDLSPFSAHDDDIRRAYERDQIPDASSIQGIELLHLLKDCQQSPDNHDGQLRARLTALLKYLDAHGPRNLYYDFATKTRTPRPHHVIVIEALQEAEKQARRGIGEDDSCEREDDDVSEEAGDVEVAIASHKQDVAILHNQKDILTQEFRDSSNLLAQWKQERRQELQAQTTKAMDELKTAEKELQMAAEQLNYCRRAIVTYDEDITRLTRAEAQRKQCIAAKEAGVRTLLEKLATLDDTWDRLCRRERERNAQISAQYTADQKCQVDNVSKAPITTKEVEVRDLRQTLTARDETLARLRQIGHDLETQIAAQSIENQKSEAEASQYRGRIAAKHAEVRSLSEDLARLESSVSRTRQKAQEFRTHISSHYSPTPGYEEASVAPENAADARMADIIGRMENPTSNTDFTTSNDDTSLIISSLQSRRKWIVQHGEAADKREYERQLAEAAANLDFAHVQTILDSAQTDLARHNVVKALQASWKACGLLKKGVPVLGLRRSKAV